jgi:hypothetical protein
VTDLIISGIIALLLISTMMMMMYKIKKDKDEGKSKDLI